MDRFEKETLVLLQNTTCYGIASGTIAAWGRKLVQEEQVGALKPAPKTKEGAKS